MEEKQSQASGYSSGDHTDVWNMGITLSTNYYVNLSLNFSQVACSLLIFQAGTTF